MKCDINLKILINGILQCKIHVSYLVDMIHANDSRFPGTVGMNPEIH